LLSTILIKYLYTMKKNRSSLIITLVLVFVSLYFLFFRNGFSTLNQKDNEFAVLDTAAITKIFMADKDSRTVTLTRVKGAEWKVNSKYDVRSDAINTLLYTMKLLAVKNIIDPRGVPEVIKGLASGGIKVEIYEGDSRVKVYYVGGPTADQEGTFMLLANPRNEEPVKQPYIVYIPGFDGYLTTRYFIREDDWRNRTVFQYYPYAMKMVKMVYPQSDSGFQINILGKNRFSIENPTLHTPVPQFDTVALKQYLTYYQSVSWETTVDMKADKKDSIIHSTPIAVIDVVDTANKSSEIRLFNKAANDKQREKYGTDYKYDPDQMFALVNGQDFVMVQYFIFGKMFQPISYFKGGRRNVEK
jgi:hypothetical protein